MPVEGVEEWDRPGGPAYDPDGLAAMVDEVQKSISEPIQLTEVACHINDQAFVDAALAILDDWIASGVVQAAS